jgi:hypothetical protein
MPRLKKKSTTIPLLSLLGFLTCSRVNSAFLHFTFIRCNGLNLQLTAGDSTLGNYVAQFPRKLPTFRKNLLTSVDITYQESSKLYHKRKFYFLFSWRHRLSDGFLEAKSMNSESKCVFHVFRISRYCDCYLYHYESRANYMTDYNSIHALLHDFSHGSYLTSNKFKSELSLWECGH